MEYQGGRDTAGDPGDEVFVANLGDHKADLGPPAVMPR